MAKQYIVDPPVVGDVFFGTEGNDTQIYVGRLAETGAPRKLYFTASREFVALLLGKRGSGKSHTLGAILEGFATQTDENTIAHHHRRPATLLLDPMGNFWTTSHLVTPTGPEKVRKQFASLDGWRCNPEPVNVTIWLPAGVRSEFDPPNVQDFRVRVSDLDAADIADLIGINLIKDAQGAALAEAFTSVTQEGWNDGTRHHGPKSNFSFTDLVNYLEYLRQISGGDHQLTTIKALVRSLRALERQPVFSGTGTPLTDLLRSGSLSVLMLPLRVGADLRRVITRLLIRRILREREQASQIRNRLDVENVDQATRDRLESELQSRIPRSILALDEAQELLGDEGGEARKALEDFCLLGRNYGLSLLLATQRPAATAISPKVRSQVDVYLIHRLLTQEDIDVSWSNLLGLYPKEVSADGERSLDFPQLVRSLERGQVIVSASIVRGKETVNRIVIGQVRPRITVHGGEVE